MFTAKQSAKFKKDVGKRLREWITNHYGERREYKFANQIGISQGTLSEILNGISSPSAETLVSIQEKTELSILWLLTGEQYQWK